MDLRGSLEDFSNKNNIENLYISILVFIPAFILIFLSVFGFLTFLYNILAYGLISISFYYLWNYLPENLRKRWEAMVSFILIIIGIFLLFILFFMSYLATYYDYIIWKEIGKSFSRGLLGENPDFYIFYTVTIPILFIITSLTIKVKNSSVVIGMIFVYMCVLSWMYVIMEGIYFQYSTTGTGFAEMFKPRSGSEYIIAIGVGSGDLSLWPEKEWYPFWIMGYREIFGVQESYSWFPVWVVGYQTLGIGGRFWYFLFFVMGFIYLIIAVISFLNAFYKETGVDKPSFIGKLKTFLKNYYNALKFERNEKTELIPVSSKFIQKRINKINYLFFIAIYIVFMILMGSVISLSWIFWASGIFILSVGFVVFWGIGERYLGKIKQQEIYAISVLFTVMAFYIPFLIIASLPQTQQYLNVLSDNFTFQMILILPVGLSLSYITYVFASRGKIMKMVLELAWIILILIVISSTLQYIFGIIFEKGRGREIADANLIFEVGMLFSIIGISAIVGIYYGYRSSIVVLIPGITIVLLFPIIRDFGFLLVSRESVLNIFKYQNVYENQQIFVKIDSSLYGFSYYWSFPFIYYYRIIISVIVIIVGFFVLGIIANRDVSKLGAQVKSYFKF